MKQRRK